MRKLLYSLLAFSLISSGQVLAEDPLEVLEEFTVDLKDPVFSHGVVCTDKGGVIIGDGLRIQAKNITYSNRIENGVRVHAITAEGDLLLQYGEQAFVGKRLEYDFVTRSGTIYEGKTYVDVWFLGGEKIVLMEDGSYYIYGGYLTTSENQHPLWELHAGKVRITDDNQLRAKDIRLNFVELPFFWIPSLRANLKYFKDSPVRYKVTWDKKLGPRLSARYRLYSWEDFNLWVRADYRVGKGGGGALETEYRTEDNRTEFVTRSYGAIDDKSTPIQHRLNHYRLQGLYRTKTLDEKTKVLLTYDKISDEKMIGEFRSDDFEINTQKRTRLFVDHNEIDSFVNFRLQPRINGWQSLNQELPSVTIGVKPFTFGTSGIVMQNWVNASYLDYVYATNLDHYLGSAHSGRLQTNNQIYRPISLGNYFTLTPEAGIIAIFYTNNQRHHAIGQGVGTYGFLLDTRLSREFSSYGHILRPYAHFQGITRTTSSVNSHYFFSIEDGLNRINALRLGLQNNLYQRRNHCLLPSISADLFTYAFLGDRASLTTVPRAYANIGLEYPTQRSHIGFCYNIQKKVVDFINVQLSWTLNQNLAFVVEMRHRSKFDWRKADHENFILDTTRSIPNMLHSPLSDGRNTLLGQLQVRLHPLWTCHISSHAGWGRRNEPAYHSEKIDLYTLLATSWRLRLSAMFSPADIRFDWGITLVE